jgi:C4-dicarboxylate transporter DctM subunit
MITLLFVLFAIFLATNMPVAFAMGVASLGGLLTYSQVPLNAIVTRMFVAVDSFTLLAIPFFIAAGEIMNACGITQRIVDFSSCLVGHIRGGLAHVTIVAEMFFSGISGSATADVSAIGSMIIPAMEADGYDKDFAVAVNASASTMGPTIPPSIMMVIYGGIANVSVAALFLGGIIPGLLTAAGLMALCYVIAIRRGYPKRRRATLQELVTAGRRATLALMMPVIVLGGILSGVFTATEAGVVAVAYAVIIGCFVYKTIHLRDLYTLLLDAAVTTSVAMLVIATAAIFAWLLSWEGFATKVMNVLLGVSTDRHVLMLMILVALFVVGLVLEGLPILVIFGPILVPIVMKAGMDPIHFGVVLIFGATIGSVSPPVGILTFICCSIAKISVSQVTRLLWAFVAVMMAVLLLVAFIPQTVLILANLAAR